jgi:hypothetical protein
MDEQQKLQLQNMIKANNVEDQTDLIRKLKHSAILRKNIEDMVAIETANRGDDAKIYELCTQECSFLFTYYTDLFNKIRKNEIDLSLLYMFLDVLQKIEDGKMDQHEGSFAVGTILKKIYIDSALKKAEKINEQYEEPVSTKDTKQPVAITWKEFKKR